MAPFVRYALVSELLYYMDFSLLLYHESISRRRTISVFLRFFHSVVNWWEYIASKQHVIWLFSAPPVWRKARAKNGANLVTSYSLCGFLLRERNSLYLMYIFHWGWGDGGKAKKFYPKALSFSNLESLQFCVYVRMTSVPVHS